MPDSNNLKIGLAPMAGITDSAFRLMNVWGGADLVYSEMAHVNALSFGGKKTLGMLATSPFEKHYVIQLFGNDPKCFGKAAKLVSNHGIPVVNYKPFRGREMRFIENLNLQPTTYDSQHKAQSSKLKAQNHNSNLKPFQSFFSRFIQFQKEVKKCSVFRVPCSKNTKPRGLDINLGCPAKKVFGHGSGAKLFEDVPKIRAILESVLTNTDLPVSLKMRSAVGDVSIFDVLEKVKDLPLKRIMVHGRSYEQGFSGEIDYKIIKEVKKKYPQFEFWANGGINDWESAEKVIKKASCSNLGIARGALGNPLLAEEIKMEKRETRPNDIQSGVARNEKRVNNNVHSFTRSLVTIQSILAYIHTILNHQSKGKKGMLEIRKHLAWYFKGFPEASKLRTRLVTIKSIGELEKILREINSVYN